MKWNKPSLSSLGSELVVGKSVPAGFPAFAPIVSDGFDHLKDLPPIQTFDAGHVLLPQGSTGETVYLLRAGLVKLTHGTPEGRETTLGLRSAGWCAGAIWALTRTPSLYSITAITPCSVSCVSATEFSAMMMQNTRLLRHFLRSLCNELMSHSACQVQMSGWSAESRLRKFMNERNAQNTPLKTMDALPLLKQMELAQLLAITPEHLSRLMHKTAVAPEPETLAPAKVAEAASICHINTDHTFAEVC